MNARSEHRGDRVPAEVLLQGAFETWLPVANVEADGTAATVGKPAEAAYGRLSFFDFQYFVPAMSAWAIRPLLVS